MYSSNPTPRRNTGLARVTVALLRTRCVLDERLPAAATAPIRVLTWVWLLLLGAEIPSGTRIGRNLVLPHGGRGVVIHPAVCIGDDVTIYHQVTLGVRGSRDDAPVIGDGVYIGTKASVLGPVHVGPGARIGAGAVVIDDVPAGATATGVPARMRRTHEEHEGPTHHDGTGQD